ncbi:MAG: hypothetical protein NUW37_20285 [Planctomycetes bacterium]|nr:hypothetical protein [Planctomycetota bacterium]
MESNENRDAIQELSQKQELCAGEVRMLREALQSESQNSAEVTRENIASGVKEALTSDEVLSAWIDRLWQVAAEKTSKAGASYFGKLFLKGAGIAGVGYALRDIIDLF